MPSDTTCLPPITRRISSEFARKAKLFITTTVTPRLFSLALLPLTRPTLPDDPDAKTSQLMADAADLARIEAAIASGFSVPVIVSGDDFHELSHERFAVAVATMMRLHEIQFTYPSRGAHKLLRPLHVAMAKDIKDELDDTARGQRFSRLIYSVTPHVAIHAHPMKSPTSLYSESSIDINLTAISKFKSIESCMIYLRAIALIVNSGKPCGDVEYQRRPAKIEITGSPDDVFKSLGIGWDANHKSFRQRIPSMQDDLASVGVIFKLTPIYRGVNATNSIHAYSISLAIRDHNVRDQVKLARARSQALERLKSKDRVHQSTTV